MTTFLKRTAVAALGLPLCLAILFYIPYGAYLLVSAIWGISVVEWFFLTRKRGVKDPVRLLGLCYGGLSFFLLLLSLSCASQPELLLLAMLGTIWACDTGGYIFGMLIGGPKLWSKISPKKTWAGFFGGLLSLSIVALSPLGDSFWSLLQIKAPFSQGAIILLFAAFAQAGDLIESKAKRVLGVKDSSPLLPGHGGVLDRFDSLMGLSFALSFLLLF